MFDFNSIFNGVTAGIAGLFMGAPDDAQRPQTTQPRSTLVQDFDMARVPDYARCEAAHVIDSMPAGSRITFTRDPQSRPYGDFVSYDLDVNSADGKSMTSLSWKDHGDLSRVFYLDYESNYTTAGGTTLKTSEYVPFYKEGHEAPTNQRPAFQFSMTTVTTPQGYTSRSLADVPRMEVLVDRMRGGCGLKIS